LCLNKTLGYNRLGKIVKFISVFIFLAHLTQRVMWGIAITWHLSSVR
jgi:hypothetical protein